MFSQYKYLSSSQSRSIHSNAKWQPSGIQFSRRFVISVTEVGQINAQLRNFVNIMFARRSSQSKTVIFCWNLRVVVLQTLKFTMLNILHDTHIGIVRMNSLARSRIWWPGIDADIERLCSQCVSCSQDSKDPTKFQLSVWDFPSG